MNLHGMMHGRAPVAQLDRAPDFESVGRRFESCRARQPSLADVTLARRLRFAMRDPLIAIKNHRIGITSLQFPRALSSAG